MPQWAFNVVRICVVASAPILTPSAQAQEKPIGPAEAKKFIGQVKTVCGTVASTTYAIRSKGQPTYLDLGRPYPDHPFTTVIWGSDKGKFRSQPDIVYKGRKICVSGLISSNRGKPQIVVREPAQIKTKSAPRPVRNFNKGAYHQRYTPDERKTLKGILTLFGYNLDSTSDRWDKATRKAVRSFQAANQLEVDGKIGPATLRAMANAVLKKSELTTKERAEISRALIALAQRKDTRDQKKE